MKLWWASVTSLVLAASVALYACTLPTSPRQIAQTTLPSVVSVFTEGPVGRHAVFVMSNPRGYEGTFSQGIVSAIRREGGIDVMQISAPIAHGSSGGPVLNTAGRVIGVASALVDGEQNISAPRTSGRNAVVSYRPAR